MNSLDNASWDVNSEIQNQGYFEFSSKHRLKHSFDLPPGRGHLMNGLKNQIPDTIQSSCDKSYHKVDSISVPIYNNDSALQHRPRVGRSSWPSLSPVDTGGVKIYYLPMCTLC